MAHKKQTEKARAAKAAHHPRRGRFRTLLWTSVIAGLALTVIGVVRFALPPSNQVGETPNTGVPEVLKDDWIEGNPNAPVTLLEYSDFQCPACGAYFPILKELNAEFNGQLRIVYRHFPFDFHPYARLAARAAEAAGKQGRFWEMHDLIFTRQKQWSEAVGSARPLFLGYAQEIGLDRNRFGTDLDSKESEQEVEADRRSGERLGLNGTPTFFLNGVKIQNPRGYEPFKSLIQKAIADAS